MRAHSVELHRATLFLGCRRVLFLFFFSCSRDIHLSSPNAYASRDIVQNTVRSGFFFCCCSSVPWLGCFIAPYYTFYVIDNWATIRCKLLTLMRLAQMHFISFHISCRMLSNSEWLSELRLNSVCRLGSAPPIWLKIICKIISY